MRFAVDPVDDQIALVVQFVSQPLADDTAKEDTAILPGLEHSQLALPAAHGALHGANDVAALAHCPQRGFGAGVDGPRTGLLLGRQAHALQAL